MALAATMSPVTDVASPPVLFVRPDSNVQGTAKLITSSIEEEPRGIILRAIGAGAVNQAVKAVICARQQMSSQGFDLILKPGFINVEGNDGGEVTAVVLRCMLL